MSDQSTPDANLLNDVQVIRNILLGEHLEKFQKRIEVLEKEISDLQKDNRVLRKMIEAENDNHAQALVARTEQFETSVVQIKNQHIDAVESLRTDLGSEVREFNRRLSAHEDQQNGLFASLAEILSGYQKQPGN